MAVLLVFGVPGQLQSLAGQEHGRSIPLPVIGVRANAPLVLSTPLQEPTLDWVTRAPRGYRTMSDVADAARRPCDDGHFVFETPHDDTPSRNLLGQIVVHDLSEIKRQVGDQVDAGDDFEDRKIGQWRERMRIKLQCRRP